MFGADPSAYAGTYTLSVDQSTGTSGSASWDGVGGSNSFETFEPLQNQTSDGSGSAAAGAGNSNGAPNSTANAGNSAGNGLAPNAQYLAPGNVWLTTDGNGNISTAAVGITGPDGGQYEFGGRTLTIPPGTVATVDLSQLGLVTVGFSNPIAIVVPLIPNPTISSVTFNSDGTYNSYQGTNGYWGIVGGNLSNAINSNATIGTTIQLLPKTIGFLGSISTQIPPPTERTGPSG